MSRYEGENMDQILPDLAEGEKEHILAKNGELPLRKKGNGKSIMINKFLTEIDGRLKLKPTDIEQYPTVLAEACEYLEPGKDREGIGGKLAEYAVKKYRSHRRIPDKVIEELNQIEFS
ncbi:hypothetical protein RhiirA5_382635 [Rhizophagus irregularis]|uniref:Uncharacterized protein n=1 Tax=Rhizophagus irregularis TaxID=588596 RepID=A0A2N0P041_9GLOM|nr:hypothetical protein RhiirA5_382635 [Rhizophagus irregularis]